MEDQVLCRLVIAVAVWTGGGVTTSVEGTATSFTNKALYCVSIMCVSQWDAVCLFHWLGVWYDS